MDVALQLAITSFFEMLFFFYPVLMIMTAVPSLKKPKTIYKIRGHLVRSSTLRFGSIVILVSTEKLCRGYN